MAGRHKHTPPADTHCGRPGSTRSGSGGGVRLASGKKQDLTLSCFLHDNAITIDASYNATMFGPDSGLAPGRLLTDACALGPMVELPMTVFRDGLGRLRPVQS